MPKNSRANEELLEELEELKIEIATLKALNNQDIRERALITKELLESEAQLREVLDNSSDASYKRNLQTNEYEYLSTVITRISGYTPKEFMAFPLEMVISCMHPDDLVEVTRVMTVAMTGLNGEVYQMDYRFKHKDGQYRWFHDKFSVSRNEAGKALSIFGSVSDITAHKQIEDNLRDQDEHLKIIFDTLSEGVALNEIIFNDLGEMIDYKIVEVNNAFYKIAGISNTTKVIGKKASELYGFDEGYVKYFWQNHKNVSETIHTELELPSNNRVFSISTSPFKSNRFVTSFHDTTDKKKMLDDLVKANELTLQSNRLKDAFIANMSHEIRTPLNGILGMTSVIREICDQNITESEEKYFDAVDKSGQRILRTIDMVLNYSSLQVGAYNINKEEFELSSICGFLYAEFKPIAAEKTINFSFIDKIGKVFVYADKNSISQSISGLIDNAIKFTNSGFVKIELDKCKNNEIILRVKDSGIGISDEYLEHIFEPYSQEQVGYGRAYDGVGLGLAIVKRILELNDATISVVSKKGEGTIFTIYFENALVTSKNRHSVEVNMTINENPPNPKNLTKKIKPLALIVENDEVCGMLIGEFISKSYDIMITTSSDEVISILNGNKIDIILMDISILGSKNGLELTTELKALEKFSSIPIIAVTAHATLKDRINSLAAGCDDYLKKPFTQNELLSKMDSLLAKML